jgi:RNA polymerase sigma-70 factor, ECF subfamily
LRALPEMALRLPLTKPNDAVESDVARVHAEHAEYVWRTLHRLGVRNADIEDLLQEVFVVVHRRLATLDASAQVTGWLFAIALRVAQAYRRRAYFRRERPFADVPDRAVDGAGPEQQAAVEEQRAHLRDVLDTMDLQERAIFVMFELEEMPCAAIADMLGIPIGTVYSRLHAARRSFEKAVARFEEREATRLARLRRGGR